jgi:hypothetical protein
MHEKRNAALEAERVMEKMGLFNPEYWGSFWIGVGICVMGAVSYVRGWKKDREKVERKRREMAKGKDE